MTPAFDPRRTPVREDLAAAHLRDRVRAPRYVEGEQRQVTASSAPLRAAPRFDAPLLTEALNGEIVTLYDIKDGWGWGQLASDGYVGFMTVDGLSTQIETPTHKVSARWTFVYPVPDIKRPPFMRLFFSSDVIVFAQEGRFAELSRGGFVFAGHIVPRGERAKDFVRVAERFVGTPYLWGGKTSAGLDCSALVQLSLTAAGVPCPRDSDMQEAEIGEPIETGDLGAVQRGDLIFWRGHVAIATSPDFIVHANAYHMETAVEPLRRAVERIGEHSGPITSIRRLRTQPDERPGPDTMAQGEKPGAAQKLVPSPTTDATAGEAPRQPAPRASSEGGVADAIDEDKARA